MDLKDKDIGIKSNVTIEVFDAKTNKLIERRRQHNLITTQGLGAMLQLVNGKSTSYVRYCAVGTGVGAESRGDTGLGTYLANSRKEYTEAYTSEISSNLYRCSIKTFYGRNQANATWTEVGMFTGDNNTSLVSRIKLDTVLVKNVTKTCVVTFTWDLSESV